MTINRLIYKLKDLNSDEMIQQVVRCEKQMLRKILRVKKCINKLIKGAEIVQKCKKILNTEVVQTSPRNEIPLQTLPEEVGESDHEEVKSHVNLSRLEIAQDREVYERQINPLDFFLAGSYRDKNPTPDNIDSTPVRH